MKYVKGIFRISVSSDHLGENVFGLLCHLKKEKKKDLSPVMLGLNIQIHKDMMTRNGIC